MLSVQHNMLAWNAERQFNITTNAKKKKTEKLSSGYRINRAADDAAGLAISEKMRRQIRGLQAGTENAQNGVSWVQIGEGALNEAHDILHRMNELTIKAQNGTNTERDRAYMQEEFEHLQSELDRISTTTTFNELNIFREHEAVYDQICGNKRWNYEQIHEIEAGRNQLIINYRDTLDSKQKTITLEVPPGRYTTHELIDELDTSAGIAGPIHMEYTEKGFCSVNLEGGEIIDNITGDLTYLLWDTYDGGGYGALIGTTSFVRDTDTLEIVQGQNDYMEFEIEFFDKDIPTQKIKIDLIDDSEPAGTKVEYTKEELMKIIDAAVPADTGLKTSHHGDAIMLSSDKGIVTGFKGNMFKIENKTDPKIYTSVFYDNIQYGYVWHDPASVVGGAVLTSDTRDKEHNRYYIDSSNNTLVLQPNLMESPTTITIDTNTKDGYTADEMVEELNKKFKAAGLEKEVKAYKVTSKSKESVGDDSVTFYGVEIRTVKEGPDSIVNIDKDKSTAYDTLFTIKEFNSYGTATDAKVDNETRTDSNAYVESSKLYNGTTTKVTIKNNVNDKFTLTLKSTAANGTTSDYSKSFTIDILASGSQSMTAAQIVSAINNQINNNSALSELKGRVEAKVVGSGSEQKIQILDKEDKTLDDVNDKSLNWNTSIQLSSAGSNTGYRSIFQREYTYDVPQTVSGKGKLEIDTSGRTMGGSMDVYINGRKETLDFKGNTSLAGIVNAVNSETPITFNNVYGQGSTQPKNFTASGSGTTSVNYWGGGSATGKSVPIQGTTALEANAPASLEIGPELKSKMVIDSTNNAITLSLNGVRKTLYIKPNDPTGKDNTAYYDMDGLAEALQTEIDKEFGTGMGGASVDVVNNRLVITSVLPEGKKGENTSITSYAKGAATNTFFEYLSTVETAASCTSGQWVANEFYLKEGDSDKFSFTFTDSSGTHNIELDLTDNTSAAGEKFSAGTLATRINTKIAADAEAKDRVKASIVDNRLVLTTIETGNGTSISYTTGPAGSTDSNADAIFGGLSTSTPARIILNQNVKASANFNGTKSFEFELDGQKQKVEIGKWTSANDLATKLNNAFLNHKDDSGQAAPIEVTASIVNGKLCLTKNDAGSGSLGMTYASGGTVMGDMFGYEAKPGVKVSYSGKKLIITAGANDVISVTSSSSGGTVAPKKAIAYETHSSVGGFHSAKYSTVTSNALNPNGVVLDRWNNDLQFTFKQGTKSTKVEITLTESAGGVPTSLEDIKKELQEKIDAKLGKGAIEVLLDQNKLSLKSMKPGSEYQFSGLQSNASGKTGGGFFHHVMSGYTEKKSQLADPTDINGEQWADDIFAQGRHDVVTELTKLKPGISDTLILDLTYIPDTDHDNKIENDKKQTITLELHLDPNMREEDFYNSDKLKKMIQEKLNEAINSTEVQEKAANLGIRLHENLIEVDVGRHKTDVWGNKDNVAISFTMTKDHDIATPVEGYFYIDGVRGNAAYETFYHTEGELIPAYIIGTKDINDGVYLGPNDTELSFVVDDEEFTVKLDQGKYTAEGLIDALTKKFEEQDIPLAAEITKKGALKISHQRMGKHVIEKVSGGARNELFYTEHAEKKPDQERYIRISSYEGDMIDLYSPRFSTTMLHVNSLCISGIKYAEKATERIKEAITMVSQMRNTFGAIQNRLEHTINNNWNKHENLSAAESRIRDADIATEMMAFSNLSIVQQAGQAVLAQANHAREGLLALLN